jgi:hypothetical protein
MTDVRRANQPHFASQGTRWRMREADPVTIAGNILATAPPLSISTSSTFQGLRGSCLGRLIAIERPDVVLIVCADIGASTHVFRVLETSTTPHFASCSSLVLPRCCVFYPGASFAQGSPYRDLVFIGICDYPVWNY